MASINATTSSGIVATADNTGQLQLQSAGTTVATVTSAGITFAANPGGLSSQALNDYEYGTWTPNLVATSGSITAQTTTGSYVKVGRLVVVQLNITSITVGASTALAINNLPFTVNSTGSGSNGEGVAREDKATGFLWFLATAPGTTTANLFRYDNSSTVTSSLGWNGTITYISAV
jgi:hypothetical protein